MYSIMVHNISRKTLNNYVNEYEKLINHKPFFFFFISTLTCIIYQNLLIHYKEVRITYLIICISGNKCIIIVVRSIRSIV